MVACVRDAALSLGISEPGLWCPRVSLRCKREVLRYSELSAMCHDRNKTYIERCLIDFLALGTRSLGTVHWTHWPWLTPHDISRNATVMYVPRPPRQVAAECGGPASLPQPCLQKVEITCQRGGRVIVAQRRASVQPILTPGLSFSLGHMTSA